MQGLWGLVNGVGPCPMSYRNLTKQKRTTWANLHFAKTLLAALKLDDSKDSK